jgi:hypothetical protein
MSTSHEKHEEAPQDLPPRDAEGHADDVKGGSIPPDGLRKPGFQPLPSLPPDGITPLGNVPPDGHR